MSIWKSLFGKKRVEPTFRLPERANIYYLICGRKFIMDDIQYGHIKDIIEWEGYGLFHMPHVMSSLDKAVMKYNFPGVKVDITQEKFTASVLKQLNLSLGEDCACLVWYNEDLEVFEHTEPQCGFEAFHEQVYYKFNAVLGGVGPDISFSVGHVDGVEETCDYCADIPMKEMSPCSSPMNFSECCTPAKDNLFEDWSFDAADEVKSALKSSLELEMLAREAKMVIDRLLMSGYSAEVIKSWLEPEVKLSRIRITRRFKIILVDYDMEVKMGPLPKTVFLFFLKHPEGLRFVDLPDYRQEIYDIYSRLAVSDDLEKIKRSVDLLTDPFDNSINEKCTMIKYAFQKVVKDEIASNYYISGRQGHVMRIPLDRTLVEWE